MSGGAWEYVMGVMLDKNGKPLSGRNEINNSGFNGSFGCPSCDGDSSGSISLTTGKTFPSDIRYYDTYDYAEVDEKYERRILGDATGEMGPFATLISGSQTRKIGSWYGDESWFIAHAYSWFKRSGDFDDGSDAGINGFGNAHGYIYDSLSFRIVLSF